jgi:hypothetical protein
VTGLILVAAILAGGDAAVVAGAARILARPLRHD